MYKYHLSFGPTQVFLFESQFQFLTEDSCLRHYEKGLVKGLFSFDRARIDQVWSQLGLWGLIGRIRPVELVRVLCAFGCELEVPDGSSVHPLTKSFQPVTYFISVSEADQPKFRHFYHWPLEPNSSEHIPVLLELDDQLVLGSYYYTNNSDVDSQLSKFCALLSQDLCLPADVLRVSLRALFESGLVLAAKSGSETVTLAHLNSHDGTIRGSGEDRTLFFLRIFDDAA